MDTGVLINFYEDLLTETDIKSKNRIIKSAFRFMLDRKPSPKEHAMLFRLVMDFDYEIVFNSLVATRYGIGFDEDFWGYLFTVCRAKMEEYINSKKDDHQKDFTDKLLNDLRDRGLDVR